MLDPAQAFSIGGLLAVAGWLGLTVALFWKPLRPVAWGAAQIAIPAVLAVAYILLFLGGGKAPDGAGFGSIEEVRALFSDDDALAAGWLHYLAFDLFVGAWITRDGAVRGVPTLAILPCLPLTFMWGPAGLLLYFAVRFATRANPGTAS